VHGPELDEDELPGGELLDDEDELLEDELLDDDELLEDELLEDEDELLDELLEEDEGMLIPFRLNRGQHHGALVPAANRLEDLRSFSPHRTRSAKRQDGSFVTSGPSRVKAQHISDDYSGRSNQNHYGAKIICGFHTRAFRQPSTERGGLASTFAVFPI